jgi:hypothetical protein
MRFARTLTTIAATVAVAAGALIAAAPASAAPANCNTGLGCTFKNSGFSGGYLNFFYNIKDYGDIGYWAGGGGLAPDEDVSSVFNNGTSGARTFFYKTANYGGTALIRSKGLGYTNLANNGSWNDSISSACFEGYCN